MIRNGGTKSKRRAPRAVLVLIPLAVLALLATACDPQPFASAGVVVHMVTPGVSGDNYSVTTSAGAALVIADGSTVSGNRRILFYSADAPIVENQQVCMVISSQSNPQNQQGLALRIRSAFGLTQAILVTKNIYPTSPTFINVHTYIRPDADPNGASLNLVGQFDYTNVFGNFMPAPGEPGAVPQAPLPWSICAQVSGTTLRVKAWRGDEQQPAWSDGEPHNHLLTLPAEWFYSGRGGWFAGHLVAYQSTTLTGLSTATL